MNGTHYVYFLECTSFQDKKCYYVGYTSRTPSQRFIEHIDNVRDRKTIHYTGRFRFVKLLCYQSFKSQYDALKTEKIYHLLSHQAKTELIEAIKKNARRKI